MFIGDLFERIKPQETEAAAYEGWKVFMVKGKKLRKKDTPFIGGDNPAADSSDVPKKTIWIERMLDQEDEDAFLVHELVEYYFIEYGKHKYPDAHDKANDAENRVRNGETPEKVYTDVMQDEEFRDIAIGLSKQFANRTKRPVKEAVEGKKFRIGALPRDMREELFNLYATHVNPEAKERDFYKAMVPTGVMDITRLDVDQMPEGSTQGLVDMGASKWAPLVTADSRLVDGQHRIQAARRLKVTKLPYIDMTGLIDTEQSGYITDLPQINEDQQLHQNWEIPIPTTKSVAPRPTLLKDKIKPVAQTYQQVLDMHLILPNRLLKVAKPVWVSLDKLRETERNNKLPDGQTKAWEIAKAIRKSGKVEAVLASEDGRLWDGHHRLEAFRKMGLGEIPVQYMKLAEV